MARACGDCAVCCKIPGIEDEKLNKKPNTWCQYCDPKASRPCTIYENRPNTCQTFSCLWLTGEEYLKDDLRPDRSKMMFTALDSPVGVLPQGTVVAWEVVPGAFDRPKNKRILEKLSSKIIVFQIFLGGGRKIIGPPAKLQEVSRQVNQALLNKAKRVEKKDDEHSNQG